MIGGLLHTGLSQVSSDVSSSVKDDNFSFSPVLTFSLRLHRDKTEQQKGPQPLETTLSNFSCLKCVCSPCSDMDLNTQGAVSQQ